MYSCPEADVLKELLSLLQLEQIEVNIFRGQSQDLGFGSVFGGQVLGQALSAAARTVDAQRRCHSLHAYFMRPGMATRPIIYEVDCIRDGKSFTTRRVIAIQKGRAIFSMSASFQINEPGFTHQDEFPQVPGPEGIASDLELALKFADKIPPRLKDIILCPKPIEIRTVNPVNPFAPRKIKPVKHNWFRAVGQMPDDPVVHQCLLAYASDFGLVITSLNPHGHSYLETDMQIASLDHAIWFHRDFRIDEWLLYSMTSPNAEGSRGLSIGKIFTRDGLLVASVAQEGLIRYHGSD
jgi:acyl-CoA thioesterase-2